MSLPKLHIESLNRHLAYHDEQLDALSKIVQHLSGVIDRIENRGLEAPLGDQQQHDRKVTDVSVLKARRSLIEEKIELHRKLLDFGQNEEGIGSLSGRVP